MAAWNEIFDQKIIANDLNAELISSEGKSNRSIFRDHEQVALLLSAIKLNKSIPDTERTKIINRARQAVASTKKITPESIIKEVSFFEAEYLAQPKVRYRLVTSISLDLQNKPKRFNINDSEITIGWKTNRKTYEQRELLIARANNSIYGNVPLFYTVAAISINARSIYEAADNALSNIDLLRGIWNLWENQKLSTRISSGKPDPVNKIVLGPIHTLHKMNGELAEQIWWFEPTYQEQISNWKTTGGENEIFNFTNNVRKKLKQISYRDDVESALIRYARALDSRNYGYSFLQLWSIIELLTGTTQTDTHKTTIKRAAFVFADRDYVFQMLQHLRSTRNLAIHSGKEVENIETIMFQAKRIVEQLFIFHLHFAGKFKSVNEAASFLDSPNSKEIIEREIRKLNMIKNFLTSYP